MYISIITLHFVALLFELFYSFPFIAVFPFFQTILSFSFEKTAPKISVSPSHNMPGRKSPKFIQIDQPFVRDAQFRFTSPDPTVRAYLIPTEQKGIPMKSSPPFYFEKHTLTVIPTDLAEPEALIRKLAEEALAAKPDFFTGKRPCVYFRFPYVPPCEKFGLLRKQILLIQESTGLRAHFHGIVVLEATEWIGHEQEEFFIATLKYLFDHSDHLHAAVVLKNCTGTKLTRFMRNVSLSVPGLCLKEAPQLFFSNAERLEDYCRDSLRGASRAIARNALTLLTETLMRRELSDARSLSLIDQTIRELIVSVPNRSIISEITVRQYLERPDTTLAMMLGAPALGERSRNTHESQL